MTTSMTLREFEHLLHEALHRIRHCVNQLDEDQIWWRAHTTHNSIGNLMLHVAGNLHQWCIAGLTDQQDIRDRESEFSADHSMTRTQLLNHVESVVERAINVLKGLTDDDLQAGRVIQGFAVTGLQALFHTVPHFVGHTHQIVLMTRLLLGDAYQLDFSLGTPNRPGVPLQSRDYPRIRGLASSLARSPQGWPRNNTNDS